MGQPIRIETPSALTGFLLVQKLERLGAEVHEADGTSERWEVRLQERAAGRLHEAVAAVQRWLDEERIPSTAVWADGTRRVLRRAR